jgi:hypothetical protein
MKKHTIVLLVLLLAFMPGLFGALVSPEPQRRGPSMEALMQIQARHEHEIMAKAGVLGMGIGLGDDGREPVFLVLVERDVPMPALPTQLENVKVKTKRSDRIMAQDGGSGCYPCHNDKVGTPVPMGLSTLNNQVCGWCSLGFKACHPGSKTIGYLTNNHCNPNSMGCENGAATGTPTYHRGSGLAGCQLETQIGTLFSTRTISFSSTNLVDASFVNSGNSLTSSNVFDLGTHTQTPVTATLGMKVQKSGASSGATVGTVTGVNLTIGVGGYCGGAAVFAQQIMYSPDPPFDTMVLGGDSGSGVFDLNMNPVGLTFAGNGVDGFGNTVQNVLNALNLTLNIAQCQSGGTTPPGGGGCPASTAAQGTPNEAETLALLHRFRDEVLSQTTRGQQYTRLFYQFSGEAVSLMLRNPELLWQTQDALERFAPVVQSIVENGGATVKQVDLQDVDQLLTAFAAAGSPTLRRTLDQLKRDLRDRRVQAEFGIAVIP